MCRGGSCRADVTATLAARGQSHRPSEVRATARSLRPDADADVTDISGFDDIAPCGVCGRLIKPAVAFLGVVEGRGTLGGA